MECIELFSTPIYKFKYQQHEEHKSAFMHFLSNLDLYKNNTQVGSPLNFTSPNLHVENTFKPFVDFCQTNLESVMQDLGFFPNIQITGMWATRHINNGSHHRHTHGNSFLAGVYYLHGNEYSSGTTFYNPTKYHDYIIPAVDQSKGRKMRGSFNTKFEEGYLYIFPAWLEHSTGVNNMALSNVVRHILSFNTLPLGKTNHDEFDRYDFQQAHPENMINSRSDRFK